METISGRQVLLRPVTRDDVPALRAILAHPGVLRWWGEQEDDLGDLIEPQENETSYAIVLPEDGGSVAGLIQSWEETTPQYRHAGIDIAVDPGVHGRGVGTDALVALARFLLERRGHHRLTIDPAADNAVAISVYAKIGFRPVGLLRQYERGLDGTWHDGLLMDLLAGELRDPGAAAQG
ncbi:GNAT family protein [Conexibacter sp. JD483]|uniref:GNAT family N-acetyltransferase n=1 Tax=unclassified Conexibacter TaxID=2627773 RepID=UPI00272153C3|nr:MULTISPECIES: GNAT family protein [unclassified Conexibacter]MDO8185525.1 GNAT family protein [Conexibacter sp. CPCC 205706]MDO8197288.1 GNAT family protein [Conexibacter sp. CPCC 205762]MDR9370784.1 GNAT family protein [Conexibacter sp. JD483]